MNSTIEQIKLTLIVFLVEIRRGEQHNIMAGFNLRCDATFG